MVRSENPNYDSREESPSEFMEVDDPQTEREEDSDEGEQNSQEGEENSDEYTSRTENGGEDEDDSVSIPN